MGSYRIERRIPLEIGRRIYFEIETGNVIIDIGERQGSVLPTTSEHDITTYKALAERVVGTFAYIELTFGQLAQDFAECNGYRINVDKISKLPFEEGYKALEFSYPNPNNPEAPLVYERPLSEQILELSLKQFETNQVLAENSAAQQDLLELLIDMGGI